MIPHIQSSGNLKTTSTTDGQLYQAETFCLCFWEKWRCITDRKKKIYNVKKIYRLASFLSSQVAESKILEEKKVASSFTLIKLQRFFKIIILF